MSNPNKTDPFSLLVSAATERGNSCAAPPPSKSQPLELRPRPQHQQQLQQQQQKVKRATARSSAGQSPQLQPPASGRARHEQQLAAISALIGRDGQQMDPMEQLHLLRQAAAASHPQTQGKGGQQQLMHSPSLGGVGGGQAGGASPRVMPQASHPLVALQRERLQLEQEAARLNQMSQQRELIRIIEEENGLLAARAAAGLGAQLGGAGGGGLHRGRAAWGLMGPGGAGISEATLQQLLQQQRETELLHLYQEQHQMQAQVQAQLLQHERDSAEKFQQLQREQQMLQQQEAEVQRHQQKARELAAAQAVVTKKAQEQQKQKQREIEMEMKQKALMEEKQLIEEKKALECIQSQRDMENDADSVAQQKSRLSNSDKPAGKDAAQMGGSAIVPCQARGMPMEHNFRVSEYSWYTSDSQRRRRYRLSSLCRKSAKISH